MVSSRKYLYFILEQLGGLDEIFYRAMIPDTKKELLYVDAKEMFIVDNVKVSFLKLFQK